MEFKKLRIAFTRINEVSQLDSQSGILNDKLTICEMRPKTITLWNLIKMLPWD